MQSPPVRPLAAEVWDGLPGHLHAARRRPFAGQEELGAVLLALLLKQRLGLGTLAVQREDIGCPPRQFVGREVKHLQGLLECDSRGRLAAYWCLGHTRA